MRKTFRNRFLAYLLPTLLLFAQQSAIAHIASHNADQSPDPEKSLVHLKLCGKCLAVEKLTNAPIDAEHRLDLLQAGYSLAPVSSAILHSRNPARHSCRDPPQIL